MAHHMDDWRKKAAAIELGRILVTPVKRENKLSLRPVRTSQQNQRKIGRSVFAPCSSREFGRAGQPFTYVEKWRSSQEDSNDPQHG